MIYSDLILLFCGETSKRNVFGRGHISWPRGFPFHSNVRTSSAAPQEGKSVQFSSATLCNLRPPPTRQGVIRESVPAQKSVVDDNVRKVTRRKSRRGRSPIRPYASYRSKIGFRPQLGATQSFVRALLFPFKAQPCAQMRTWRRQTVVSGRCTPFLLRAWRGNRKNDPNQLSAGERE